jgi:hypothetical protein
MIKLTGAVQLCNAVKLLIYFPFYITSGSPYKINKANYFYKNVGGKYHKIMRIRFLSVYACANILNALKSC